MTLGARIKALREANGLSQIDLGRIAGVSDKAVSTWENDLKIPRMGKLQAIADFFGVPKSYIIDGATTENNYAPATGGALCKFDTTPRVGQIACGEPILAEENITEYDKTPAAWHATFTLICRGDSMAPKISDGDIVAVRQQPEVENGQIAAVLIDGEATLKAVYKHDGFLELRPLNPAYQSIIKSSDDLEDISIEGLAVGYWHTLTT